jgi:integrase
VDKLHRETLGLRGRMVPHGWRSAFSTNANDATDLQGGRLWPDDVVELCLDHLHGTKVSTSYDRGRRWASRVALMDWWNDQLERSTKGADVIEFPMSANMAASTRI